MSWAEIKKAINSDLSKPLDTLIKEYLGNSTYGLQALKNKSVIKSVQRGSASVSGTFENSVSLTISKVNPDKCLVIVNSRQKSTIISNNQYNYARSGEFFTLSDTSLELYGADEKGTFTWQVIEFY